MEACVVICRNNKPAKRRGHVIFIDAVNEVTRERSMSYLKPEHQGRVADAYHAFKDVESFARVASLADVRANDCNLSIPLYVHRISMRGKSVSDDKGVYAADGLKAAVKTWEESSSELQVKIEGLLKILKVDKGKQVRR